MLTSTLVAKEIAYMPFTKKVIYTNNKEIKEKLYDIKELNNWKQYIDYDDLGVFLLAKEVSSTFLTTFFIFLLIFMVIAFSSLVKEFETSIFLTKLYGLNIYRTVTLYTFFFILYTIAIAIVVSIEYFIFTYIITLVSSFSIGFDAVLFQTILQILVCIGFFVSLFMAKKYHRLPL
jgi:hypothetical protein